MKVQDLRVGNKIIANFGKESGEREIEVFSINESGCVYDENIDEHWGENLKGVPLTEEWLVKFGFRHAGNGFYDLIGKHVSLANIGNEYFRSGFKGKSIKNIYHVHDLQNLYHSLTGEELTIKTR